MPSPSTPTLHIGAGHKAVLVNAPPEHPWDVPTRDADDLGDAEVVFAFLTHRSTLQQLAPVFAAANNATTVWIVYPKLTGPYADIDRIWLFRELYRHGVGPVTSASVDHQWAAVLLRPGCFSDADIDEILDWPHKQPPLRLGEVGER